MRPLVLDASAALAYLLGEPDAQRVKHVFGASRRRRWSGSQVMAAVSAAATSAESSAICGVWYLDDVEKTTLYLPADLQVSLRDLSRRTGRPQAEIIREALATYVAGQERPWPQAIGSAADGRVPARDSSAWIHGEWSRADARPVRRTERR